MLNNRKEFITPVKLKNQKAHMLRMGVSIATIVCLYLPMASVVTKGIAEVNPLSPSASITSYETAIIPMKYFVTVIPHLDDPEVSLEGDVYYVLSVAEPTKYITLHAKQLSIIDVMVLEAANKSTDFSFYTDKQLDIKNRYFATDYDLYVIEMKDTLQPHHIYKMHLTFEGHVNNNMEGFFRHSYADRTANDTQVWYVGTKFYPSHTRKAFPCFDNESHEAEFVFKVGVPYNYTVFSNLREIPAVNLVDRLNVDYYKWKMFSIESIPIQMIGFVIVNDEHSRLPEYSTTWRCVKRTDNALAHINTEPLEETKNILTVYNTSTEILYGTNLLVIPIAENYTGIKLKLISPSRACAYVVNLIGLNYMTYHPSYRSDDELNEAEQLRQLTKFASDNGFGIELDSFDFPVYLDDVIVNNVREAMFNEGIQTSIPSNGYAHNLNDLPLIVSYYKAVGMLQMFSTFYDKLELYVDALDEFIYRKKYKSFDVDDLYEKYRSILRNKADANVLATFEAFLTNWRNNSGYPVLTVTKTEHNFYITQESFIYGNKVTHNSDTIWKIPIVYIGMTNRLERGHLKIKEFWLENKFHTINNTNTQFDWLLLNGQLGGYFRVNYGNDGWNTIIQHLCTSNPLYMNLDDHTKIQLFDDAFQLARAGYINYEIPFKLTKCLRYESSQSVWKIVWHSIEYLIALFDNPHWKENFYIEIQEAFESVLPETYDVNILSVLCYFKPKECFRKVIDILEYLEINGKSLNGNSMVTLEHQKTAFCHFVKFGTMAKFNQIKELYQNTNDIRRKFMLAIAMTCSDKLEAIESLLKLTFHDTLSYARIQMIIKYLTKSYEGRMKTFAYLLEEEKAIKQSISEKDYQEYFAMVIESFSNELESPKVIEYKNSTSYQTMAKSERIQKAFEIAELNRDVFWNYNSNNIKMNGNGFSRKMNVN